MESSINKRNWWIVGGLYCFLFLTCLRPLGDQPGIYPDCFRWGGGIAPLPAIVGWQKKENLTLIEPIASIKTVYKPTRPLLVFVAKLKDN